MQGVEVSFEDASFVWNDIANEMDKKMKIWILAIYKSLWGSNPLAACNPQNYFSTIKVACSYLNKLNDYLYFKNDDYVNEKYAVYRKKLGGELPCDLLDMIMIYFKKTLQSLLSSMNFIALNSAILEKRLDQFFRDQESERTFAANILRFQAKYCCDKGKHERDYKKDPFSLQASKGSRAL